MLHCVTAALATGALLCYTTGKPNHKAMNRLLTFSAVLTIAAVLAMGADNNRQLERCEASGRGQAECRLLVLGR